MMIDAVLPRFVQDKRACASTQLIKMRVHARHNSGSDVRHEKTLKFAEGRIVPGLGLPMLGFEPSLSGVFKEVHPHPCPVAALRRALSVGP